MFKKILIANRGEIACRVMKTARRLGIRTAAVYSDADAESAHVAMADEAHRIGPAPAAESYLVIDTIIGAARRAGADAIHPGYGFLSENADFAEACRDAGLVFIGPPAEAIRRMGSKSESKRIMADAQVPLVPGYHGEDQSPGRLRAEADAIGYPVLVKASAGGGGRGMRVVSAGAEFDGALTGARREAKSAFGDERILLERYLARPRHVEVQIFGDTHGNLVHLYERDCSAQRRHQKIVEEAPAPDLGDELRSRLCDAAVAAGRAIGYVGAGTVEMLLDPRGHFYFMEMNTRLQVEHPVTELVTGEDLVEWQLRVAAGDPLPRKQDEIHLHGHALEARLYAEDPSRNFMPSTGRLAHLRFPDRDPLVRIDSGLRTGDEISFHYDPMIAKVVVWAHHRERACERLVQALRETEVVGVTANADFLTRLVSHPEFVEGGIDTGFVIEHGPRLQGEAAAAGDIVLGIGALAVLLEQEERTASLARDSEDRHSPWALPNHWRLHGAGTTVLRFATAKPGAEGPHEVSAAALPDTSGGRYRLVLPGGETTNASVRRRGEGRILVTLGARRQELTVVRDGDAVTVFLDGERYALTYIDPHSTTVHAEAPAPGALSAPMPGKVVAVNVEPGQNVRRGATVMVMEAMKMEHNIIAPSNGVVEAVRYQVGDLVDEGAELLSIGVE